MELNLPIYPDKQTAQGVKCVPFLYWRRFQSLYSGNRRAWLSITRKIDFFVTACYNWVFKSCMFSSQIRKLFRLNVFEQVQCIFACFHWTITHFLQVYLPLVELIALSFHKQSLRTAPRRNCVVYWFLHLDHRTYIRQIWFWLQTSSNFSKNKLATYPRSNGLMN